MFARCAGRETPRRRIGPTLNLQYYSVWIVEQRQGDPPRGSEMV